jgi:hypothetical protein
MKKTKTYSDSKQSMWETWFVLSTIIFMCFMFAGALEGSVKMFPNWTPFALIATINLLICIIVGTRKPK